jgi:hypothetical protein
MANWYLPFKTAFLVVSVMGFLVDFSDYGKHITLFQIGVNFFPKRCLYHCLPTI